MPQPPAPAGCQYASTPRASRLPLACAPLRPTTAPPTHRSPCRSRRCLGPGSGRTSPHRFPAASCPPSAAPEQSPPPGQQLGWWGRTRCVRKDKRSTRLGCCTLCAVGSMGWWSQPHRMGLFVRAQAPQQPPPCRTSWLVSTSQMPSQARTRNSSPGCSVSLRMSGSAVTI